MKEQMLFIQQALRMGYLRQSAVMELFKAQSFAMIPDNIGEILIEKNLLNAQQVADVQKEITRSTAIEADFDNQDYSRSISLHLSGGNTVEIPYCLDEDTGEPLVDEVAPIDLDAPEKPALAEKIYPDSRTFKFAEISSQKSRLSFPGATAIDQALDLEESDKPASASGQIAIEPTGDSGEKEQSQSKAMPTSPGETAIDNAAHSERANAREAILQRNTIQEVLNSHEIASLKNEDKTVFVASQANDFGCGKILLGKYRLLEKLGAGGMGAVYKVEHIMLQHNKFFAMKVMLPHFTDNELGFKRFVREVEVTMGLIHRNIIAVRDFGLLPSQAPYLVMDYSPGVTLDQILKNNWEFDFRRSLHILRQILEGLSEAHRHNIIHRDLKPANVLIEEDIDGDDLVKIVDFGLAKLIEDAGHLEALTHDHNILGSPLYMSPEQAAGEATDRRTDIYSTGMILYEMITGKLPFHSTSLRKLLSQQLFETPTAPRQINPRIPPLLEQIILTAIAKEPKLRYQNTQEFIAAVDDYLAGASQPGPTTRVAEQSRMILSKPEQPRARIWLKVIAALLLILVLGGAIVAAVYLLPKLSNSGQKLTTVPVPPTPGHAAGQQKFKAFIRKIKAFSEQNLWKEAYTKLLEEDPAVTPEQVRQLEKLKKYLSRRIQEERDYLQTKEQANRAYEQNNFTRAAEYWRSYLRKYPDNVYRNNIEKFLSELDQARKQQIAEEKQRRLRNYQEKRREVLELQAQKLWQQAYKALEQLKKFTPPAGDERQELQKLRRHLRSKIAERADYQKIQQQVLTARTQQLYVNAIRLWKSFLEKYPKSEYQMEVMRELELLREISARNQREQRRQLLKQARKHLDSQEYSAGIALLKKLAGDNPKDNVVLELLGRAYYHQGNKQEARQWLQRAGDLPGEAMLLLGKLYAGSGEYSKAIAVVQKALTRLSPRASSQELRQGYHLLGRLYEKTGRWQEVIAVYGKMVAVLEQAKAAPEERRPYYKKLALLCYRHARDRQRILTYLRHYRDCGGKESKLLALLTGLTDFTPLAVGKKWEYLFKIGNRKNYKNYEITAKQNNRFLVEVSGQNQEIWYRQEQYFVIQANPQFSDRVLKYPVRSGSTWTGGTSNQHWQYKIVSVEETVSVPAGIFHHCIKVAARDPRAAKRKAYIFYAPDVGEVRRETLLNDRLVFEKELVRYR